MDEKFNNKNSLTEIINHYLANEKEGRSPEQGIGKFYPSSVGKCDRAIVYQMLGYPQKNKDPKSYMILENGTYFHDRIEKTFRESGILVASELPLKDERLHISGRLDLIVWNFLQLEDGENIIELKTSEKTIYTGAAKDLIIVELKSISANGFDRLGNSPKDEHKDQLTLYMELTGIHNGIVFYENKNTQECAEYLVKYDPVRAGRIIRKIEKCVECFEKKELPPKEYEKHDFQCQYCDYREICWPSEHLYNIEDIL